MKSLLQNPGDKFPTSGDFARIKAESDKHYPLPFTCDCEEFKSGGVFLYGVWGRIRGQGSPYVVEAPSVQARCSHETYYKADFSNMKEPPPKQVNCTKLK